MKLGFIGLGDMGLPMARRLLGTGNDVIAWNRSYEKLNILAAEGALCADSPAEVIARADLVGLCLTSHQAVEEVISGNNGLFSAPLSGQKCIADFSTGSVQAAVEFAERAGRIGALWLDAPVSGGVPAAVSGSLIVFAGGSEDALARLEPLFSALAARVSHMGANGTGQATKICNQMIVAANMLVMAETIAMARKAGVEVTRLAEALKDGFADSRPLQIFGPRMAAHEFEPRLGAISLMQKDVELAACMAAAAAADTPLLDRVRELYARAAKSQPEMDISALVALFETTHEGNSL